ncbi:MAG: M2 family metallopeptidase [Calditrichaeota bacterium]|nr:M2 family metallopeptidase [Calditrichota bacterium]
MEKKFDEFLEKHLKVIQPLTTEMNTVYWNAAVSGKKEDYDRYAKLELIYRKIYADSAEFALVKQLKESDEIKNELKKRQLEVLYNAYLGNQVDPDLLEKMVKKSSEVENKFSVFRATLNGKKVTDNEIIKILKKETDSRKRREAWMASKQVGQQVADDLIQLVKLRNAAAHQLGFDNYYVMSLTLGEQNLDDLTKIFDELDELTREPFKKMKAELDSILAEYYGIGAEGLMPWHYHDPFFQEGPLVYQVDLDKYYADQDVKKLARDFYYSINLEVDAILKRSDLYEKEGKNPHAFCTDIDRSGDIRVLANLQNNEQWMETILHELGHAVYDKYIDRDLPFLLREPAHSFTTEAIAMMFGRLSRNAYWLQKMINLSDEERNQIAAVVDKSLALKQLIFARWCQVMFRFERALYENPDQDLNTLWWDLVEKYQMIKRPPHRNAPDWAAKIHFTIAPVYYHNYMLGELLASQLHHYIATQIVEAKSAKTIAYVGEKEIGKYLKENVFKPGDRYVWNEMIKRATGEYLTPKYFVEQFVSAK